MDPLDAMREFALENELAAARKEVLLLREEVKALQTAHEAEAARRDLRDRIASEVLPAVIGKMGMLDAGVYRVASQRAYDLADAMVSERARRGGQ